MRLVHLVVDREQESAVRDVLETRQIDYLVVPTEEDGLLVEFPIPTDGVEDVREAIRSTVGDEGSYTVTISANTALTPNADHLQNRYASDYTPLPSYELKSKSRSLSQDLYSFAWMIFLSAVIATVGLLIDSPAIVVGSMVIAPIVGPALTTGVGAATGDSAMAISGVRYQALAVLIALIGATLCGIVLRLTGVVPAPLDVLSLDLVGVRLAPSPSAVIVGFAAGVAAAFGLSTEGPVSIIGVMVAAALVPAAATSGIGFAWGNPILALGALALLIATFVTINLGVFLTLVGLGYRADGGYWTAIRTGRNRTVLGVVIVLVVLITAVSMGMAAQQASYERSVNAAIEETITEEPQYSSLRVVTTSVEYGYDYERAGIERSPETVTIRVTTTAPQESYSGLSAVLQQAIEQKTGTEPEIRIEIVSYEHAPGRR
ncbi:DUF389 domain-containing protein [Haloferacaceae archaeon DSL9]